MPISVVSVTAVMTCGNLSTMICLLCLLLLSGLHFSDSQANVKRQQRTFEVDYEKDVFLKDGEPFRYISGSLHYFRVPRAYWRDRLRKYRAAGLNAISTYIEWKSHEPIEGKYDFSGENDLEHFIKLAQAEGLLVVLRPGPYICAERDFGGYPPWLLYENPEMGLRTNESSHTRYVYSWLSELFPRIRPLLYGNGGPIIMVQVENEYGSYSACDRSYTRWLRDVFRRYVGNNAVLFTTDGNTSGYLKCGPIPGVFITVDFGATENVTQSFEDLRKIQPHGPLVNSEFYPGWLTHWGEPEASELIDSIVKATRQLLDIKASFNFYMFHGGTNFGFSSGANSPPFLPQVTSYDYDAPISESGNLTKKFYAIKKVISEFTKFEDVHVDTSTPVNYGSVTLDPKISLFDSDTGVKFGTFAQPKTFESLQLYSGFMLYETALPPPATRLRYLEVASLHDRTALYVDKSFKGVLSRSDKVSSVFLSNSGSALSLLVENEGHINYGNMTDHKGLLGNVTLNGDVLGPWKHTGYPMTDVSSIPVLPPTTAVNLPAFYSGSFKLPNPGQPPQDTFVDMTGWGKGALYVNGHNLGRYWPSLGPQVTLYLPAPFLRQDNVFVILELERENSKRTISLVAQPILNKVSHKDSHPGVLYVNGHNLGRYWPSLGPQVTLYLPAPFLRQDNVFVILELERENPNRTISLVAQPILNQTVSCSSDPVDISVVLDK